MSGFYSTRFRDNSRLRRFASNFPLYIAPPVPPTGYLESLAVLPRAVLSLRKLVSTATSAIRVRRSSDNTEQDIGFTGDALDTASLLAFVGAGSAYVTIWYDQSGNGLNATQATAASQPRIVNAGVYDGKIVFNGTSNSLKIAGCSISTSDKFAIYTKMAMASTAAIQVISELSINYNTQGGSALLVYAESGTFRVGMSNTDWWTMASIPSLSQLSVMVDRALGINAGEKRVYSGGTLLPRSGTNSLEVTGNFGAFDLYIGARAGASLFAAMELETHVIYVADTDSIRTSIESIVA